MEDNEEKLETFRKRAAPMALKIQQHEFHQRENNLEPFDLSGKYAIETLERALPGFTHVDFNTGSKQVFIFFFPFNSVLALFPSRKEKKII